MDTKHKNQAPFEGGDETAPQQHNALCIGEVVWMVLGWVDDLSLHRCACVNHMWSQGAAQEAQKRSQRTCKTNWVNRCCPEPAIFKYGGKKQPFVTSEAIKEKIGNETDAKLQEENEILIVTEWETKRWWLRFHGDCLRFLQKSVALQFAYISFNEFLIFKDEHAPMFNTPTEADCFPVRYQPKIIKANWNMLWWEDIDELLKSCTYEGILGYAGSLKPFTHKDISKILAMNAAWYIYSFEERAFFGVFLLNDGRFAFLFEASYVGTVDSRVSIRAKCILASSLETLLFFGLGDAQRAQLGINIGETNSNWALQKSPVLDMSKITQFAKKIKPTFVWRKKNNEVEPILQELQVEEDYLIYPTIRLEPFLPKKDNHYKPERQYKDAVFDIQVEEKEKEKETEKEKGNLGLDGGNKNLTQILWDPEWDEQQKEKNQAVIEEWGNVWRNCSGFHCSLSWVEDESKAQEEEKEEEEQEATNGAEQSRDDEVEKTRQNE